jgi:hypothetical protein
MSSEVDHGEYRNSKTAEVYAGVPNKTRPNGSLKRVAAIGRPPTAWGGLADGSGPNATLEPIWLAGNAALNLAERDGSTRLREENGRLCMERDIFKKAAAFFAKEPG